MIQFLSGALEKKENMEQGASGLHFSIAGSY